MTPPSSPSGRGRLCVTTDAVVEGVHFRRADGPLEDVGHKALAVNLSDLAAMGARPAWFVCALAAPALRLAGGARPGARDGRPGAALRHRAGGRKRQPGPRAVADADGGRPTGGPTPPAALGRPGRRLAVRLRDAGRGRLGPSVAARPHGALGGGPNVGSAGRSPGWPWAFWPPRYASAAIDVSDGFVQDLGHLLAASRVGAVVEAARAPRRPGRAGVGRRAAARPRLGPDGRRGLRIAAGRAPPEGVGVREGMRPGRATGESRRDPRPGPGRPAGGRARATDPAAGPGFRPLRRTPGVTRLAAASVPGEIGGSTAPPGRAGGLPPGGPGACETAAQ